MRDDRGPATSIISLQTAFGGGKTHTQLALWHLARHPDVLRTSAACAEVREVLGDKIPKKPCNVAVFTNQTCDATRREFLLNRNWIASGDIIPY